MKMESMCMYAHHPAHAGTPPPQKMGGGNDLLPSFTKEGWRDSAGVVVGFVFNQTIASS
ncbi:MAG: hypothetical protein HY272_05420 [Gammaproteobacteria bacterium]|nr:hypothetical protein [Gammaproteobacteria bacterium]